MPKAKSATTTATASPRSEDHLPGPKTKTKPFTMEEVRRNGHFLQMAVDDLVAYEYVDARQEWQWGLATVASLPGPRLVQLLIWRNDASLLNNNTNNGNNNNMYSPKEAADRLTALLDSRSTVAAESALLHRSLAAHRAAYAANRRAVEADARAAAFTLSEARLRVREIDPSDWREIRSYHSPPAIVVLVMEAVLTLLGTRVVSWAQIKSMIRGSEFVHTVEQFDPAKISQATRSKVQRKYLSNPKFTYADAMNGSQALGYLQQWVVAQMGTASATDNLMEYDIAHARERAAINEMESQIEAFEQTIRNYNNEERRLRTIMGDPPVEISNDYANGNNTSHNDYRGNNTSNHHSNLNNNTNNNLGLRNTIPSDRIDGNDIQDNNKSSNNINADPSEDVERIHGTNDVWSFSEQSIIVLRSSIICNYDKPEGMVVRLTPEQVREIEEALKNRGSNWDGNQRAEAAKRKKLQKELEDLRADHAEALKKLQELESGNHEMLQDLNERKKELDKLNQFIIESGVPLHTPRYSAGNSSLRSTPRAGAKTGSAPVPNIFTPKPIPLNASPIALREEGTDGGENDGASPNSTYEPQEDAEARIEELEEQLKRALHENPTAAQVQLLEEDLRALQEELRKKKEELDSFRNAHAPKYYTSSALRMDQENSPEAQLAAAQQQIEELESALAEALESLQQQQQQQQQQKKPTAEDTEKMEELQGQIQQLQNELEQLSHDAEAAAERLNEELHAHKDTQQKLKEKEEELKALWDRQNTADGETEASRDALQEREKEMEQLRDKLREKEEEAKRLEDRLAADRRLQEQERQQQEKSREGRAGHLHDVVDTLRREEKRQKEAASTNASVIEEVHKLLGKNLLI